MLFELTRRPEGFAVTHGGKTLCVMSNHSEAAAFMMRVSLEHNAGWWDAVDRCGIRLAHEPRVERVRLLSEGESAKPKSLSEMFAELNALV